MDKIIQIRMNQNESSENQMTKVKMILKEEGIDGIDDNNEYRLDEQLLDADSENESSEKYNSKIKNLVINDKDYKIFTTEFDEIAKAETLENQEEIKNLEKI